MHTSHRLRRVAPIAIAVVTGFAVATPPAAAHDIIAADQNEPVTVSASRAPRAMASIERGIVVTNHGGRPIVISAAGEPTVRKPRPGSMPARFGGLAAGRRYNVSVGGRTIARVVAVNRPSPASRLVVQTTDVPSTVRMSWLHRTSAATGGRSIRYDLAATSTSAPTVSATVVNRRSGVLTGLDPAAIYTFTVTPRNSAGRGLASRAAMTKSLAQLTGISTSPPASPAPQTANPPAPTPTPTVTVTAPPAAPAAPTGPSAPTTKTIYVCPDGYTEVASTCQKTLPYTYSTKTYTFHDEATGPAPLLETYETSANSCNPGYNWEDYGIAKYCRRYGPVPTKKVKDAAPAGFTDDGAQWIKKDDAPPGYTDNGTVWVTTTAKVPKVVPA